MNSSLYLDVIEIKALLWIYQRYWTMETIDILCGDVRPVECILHELS
jgi:hypothetical protein